MLLQLVFNAVAALGRTAPHFGTVPPSRPGAETPVVAYLWSD